MQDRRPPEDPPALANADAQGEPLASGARRIDRATGTGPRERIGRMGLRPRLLVLVLLAILPLFALIVAQAGADRDRARTDAIDQARRLAALAAVAEERVLSRAESVLIALSVLPEVRSLSPERCTPSVASLLPEYADLVNLVVTDATGLVVCSASPLSGPVSLGDRTYFHRAVQTRSLAIGEYSVGRITGEPLVSVALPILGPTGAVGGVAVAGLRLDALGDVAAAVALPAGATVTLVDRDGTILARNPDPEGWIGHRAPEAPLVQVLLAGGEGTIETAGVDGLTRLYAYIPVGADVGADFHLAVGFEMAMLYTEADRSLVTSLTWLGFVLVIVLVIVLFGSRTLILRPVETLLGVTRRLAAGDLGARTGLPGFGGELGRLANALDEMAASVERRVDERTEGLRRSEAELDRFFSLSHDLFTVVDLDGRFRRVNKSWERALDLPAAELLGRPYLELVHPDDLESTAAEAARQRQEGSPTLHFENRYRFADGSYHWLDWTAQPDREAGVVNAVARDVTERKQIEAALESARAEAIAANRAKSEFLSRMSHELRTPLNSVLGFAQLLGMDHLDADQRESVAHITRAGRHLLDLINEVLDISRIETGQLSLSPEPVDVHEAVTDAIALIDPLAASWGITVTVGEIAPDRHVLADRQRLKQVLLNLLSNAVKYSPPGATATVVTERADDGRIRISVTDTGPGIPPNQLDRLFAPFDRLGAEGTAAEGTGLGLALSRSLIEAMGGTIGVHSTPGEGSTFWFELPEATPVASERPVEPATPAEPATGPALTGTVLCIEDNPSNVRLVERVLALRGEVRLIPAMLGRLGLELAREHHPDLVLLDLHLPDMGGEELLGRLRADPATRAIPVVVLSADATPGQVQRLLAQGARAYLTKPLDVTELLALVDEVLAPGAEG